MRELCLFVCLFEKEKELEILEFQSSWERRFPF